MSLPQAISRAAQAIRRWLDLDRPVLLMAAGRAWSFLAGPVTLLLIAHYFSEVEQGYYYTFANLLMLQSLLEMGFSQSLIQFASHEFARLRFGPEGGLEGEAAALGRLLGLGRLALGWYGALAGLLVIGVGGAGEWFFSSQPDVGAEWRGPWWALCGVTAVNLLTQPFWFLLEGCNRIGLVYGYRTVASMASGVAGWVAIWRGAGLFTAVWAGGAALVVSLALLAWRGRHFARALWTHRSTQSGALLAEVWSFQWRMGLSAISGFLIFNLFTPVVFDLRGAEEAGRMGMSWQLVNALAALSIGWTSIRAPRYGMLISQRRFADLDRLAWRTTAQAVGLCVVGGVALLVALAWVKAQFAFGSRFLGLGAVGWLLAASVVNQVITGQAYYLRAHKREPFMGLSLLNGALTAGGVVLATGRWGAYGACLAYAVIQVVILPLATRVFLARRREWHDLPTHGTPGPNRPEFTSARSRVR